MFGFKLLMLSTVSTAAIAAALPAHASTIKCHVSEIDANFEVAMPILEIESSIDLTTKSGYQFHGLADTYRIADGTALSTPKFGVIVSDDLATVRYFSMTEGWLAANCQ